MKLDFGLKSRIYGGFRALRVLGLGLALFAGWQLHLIGASVGQMSAISDASKRIVGIGRNLEIMTWAALGLQFQHDAQSVKDGEEAARGALELLEVTLGRTASAERRKVYQELKAGIIAFAGKRAALLALGQSVDTARGKLFAVGDELIAN